MSEKDGAGEMIVLSLAGAIIVMALAWFGATAHGGLQLVDRLLVGLPLSASFILGISLAVRPGWMKRLHKDTIHSADVSPPQSPVRRRRGHHPDCEHFRPHTVTARGKVLCAGCTGLAFGSVASIVIVSLYVSISTSVPQPTSSAIAAIGIALVAASMTDSELFQARGGERLFSNLIMPIGFLLVAVGLLETTGSAVYGLVGVLISFLWLDTRIRLSRRRHIRICGNCGEACKSYLA